MSFWKFSCCSGAAQTVQWVCTKIIDCFFSLCSFFYAFRSLKVSNMKWSLGDIVFHIKKSSIFSYSLAHFFPSIIFIIICLFLCVYYICISFYSVHLWIYFIVFFTRNQICSKKRECSMKVTMTQRKPKHSSPKYWCEERNYDNFFCTFNARYELWYFLFLWWYDMTWNSACSSLNYPAKEEEKEKVSQNFQDLQETDKIARTTLMI